LINKSVLLIQPQWNEIHGMFAKLAKRKFSPPLIGISYLAATLRERGYSVRLIDAEAQQLSHEEVFRIVREENPALIGMTVTTPVFPYAKAMADFLRARVDVPILGGGPHVTTTGMKGLDSCFDFGISGEGENAILHLMDELTGGRNYEKVPNLIYREAGEVRANPQGDKIQCLDTIPFPAVDLLDLSLYRIKVPRKGNQRFTAIVLTRGCPFACSYCAEPNLFGRKVRFRTAKNAADEMEYVVSRFGIRHFVFNDSTLTLRKDLIHGLCDEIINRRLDITWEGWTRADLMQRELLQHMADSGFVRVSMGVESGDMEVLKLIRKDIPLEVTRQAVEDAVSVGIKTECFAMLGLPGETRESVEKTVRFFRSLKKASYNSFSIAIPYPGTELHTMAQKNAHGLELLSEDFYHYRRYEGGAMRVNGMTPKELGHLQKVGLIKMHLTPRKIFSLLWIFGPITLTTVGFRLLFQALFKRKGKPEARAVAEA
jgi:radical SAM superfamily enzyme YgiQ (UPF0313 family)